MVAWVNEGNRRKIEWSALLITRSCSPTWLMFWEWLDSNIMTSNLFPQVVLNANKSIYANNVYFYLLDNIFLIILKHILVTSFQLTFLNPVNIYLQLQDSMVDTFWQKVRENCLICFSKIVAHCMEASFETNYVLN